jgi:hypothetical protein
MCPRCQDARWICEQHPERPWPHGDCPGPGDLCPECNLLNPPELPPDHVTIARVTRNGIGDRIGDRPTTDTSDPFYRPGYIPPGAETAARRTGLDAPPRRSHDHVRTAQPRRLRLGIQTFKDGEFNRSRRFETHAQALQWAELEREAWSKPE